MYMDKTSRTRSTVREKGYLKNIVTGSDGIGEARQRRMIQPTEN